MIKTFFLLCLLIISHDLLSQASLHSFKVKDASGKALSLADFKGKKILIVNSASSGPKAGQLAQLQSLAVRYKDSGLVVVVFPSNDFNNEPKSSKQLSSIPTGVNFYVCEKSFVKGNSISPIYKWLTRKSENGVADVAVLGDYQKFIINKDGKFGGYFSGNIMPYDIPARALKN